MSSEDLVEVYRARDGVQAQLMASALEDDGIRAFVDDHLQTSVGSPPGWTTAPRIMVPQSDATRARTLLERIEQGEAAE